MNISISRNCTSLLVPALLFQFAFSAAAQQNKAEATRTDQNVEVKLALDKSELILGQPLSLKISVTNKGNSKPMDLVTAKLALPEGNDVEVFVQKPGELEFRYDGALERAVYGATTLDVAIQQTVSYDVRLMHNQDDKQTGYLFDKPGVYTVRARLHYTILQSPPYTLELPPARITVTAPQGQDAEAFRILNNPSCARALHLSRLPDDSTLQKLRKVVDDFPDTLYADLCARTIGIAITAREKPDYKESVRILAQLLKRKPDLPDADLIAFSIASSHHLLGNYDKAREWILYVYHAHPDSLTLRREQPLFEYYIAGPAEAGSRSPWYLAEKPWAIQGAVAPTDLSPQSIKN